MVINYFNNDERIILNGLCKIANVKTLSKAKVEDALMVSLSLIDESEEMMISLYEGTYEKLKAMKEDDWNELRFYLPFDVYYPNEDEEEMEEE